MNPYTGINRLMAWEWDRQQHKRGVTTNYHWWTNNEGRKIFKRKGNARNKITTATKGTRNILQRTRTKIEWKQTNTTESNNKSN